jgi:hypothetical protein
MITMIGIACLVTGITLIGVALAVWFFAARAIASALDQTPEGS